MKRLFLKQAEPYQKYAFSINVEKFPRISHTTTSELSSVKFNLICGGRAIQKEDELNTSFLVAHKNKNLIRTVLFNIRNLKDNLKGYCQEVLLFGTNFSMFRWLERYNLIELELHYAFPVLLDVPPGIFLRIYKRRMIVFGFSKGAVAEFINKFRDLKPVDPYTGRYTY
jgi:ribosomal protein L6P/L9E